MPEYLSVSTLTKYLKMKFERDPYLERLAKCPISAAVPITSIFH